MQREGVPASLVMITLLFFACSQTLSVPRNPGAISVADLEAEFRALGTPGEVELLDRSAIDTCQADSKSGPLLKYRYAIGHSNSMDTIREFYRVQAIANGWLPVSEQPAEGITGRRYTWKKTVVGAENRGLEIREDAEPAARFELLLIGFHSIANCT